MINSIQQVLLWTSISAVLSWLLWSAQQRYIMRMSPDEPHKAVSAALVFSGLRIISAAGVLFLAFRQGFNPGIASLLAFTIVRWFNVGKLVKLQRQAKRGGG